MHKEQRTILIQILLFIATFFTTTIAGASWVYGKSFLKLMPDGTAGWNDEFFWNDFSSGMSFSIPFLLILTVHEFGHYFTAVYHKVKTSLPYYIPLPNLGILLSVGTLGAVIRLREKVKSNVQSFDIGIAGPLAGFVVALVVIAYGFFTLPPAESIFEIHPEYKQYGLNYADTVYSEKFLKKNKVMDVKVGSNLVFKCFEFFVTDKSRIPNEHELMHYPFLFAGFWALFFTSLNLLPIGQLDGGHITYGLFGWRWHKRIATVVFIALISYAGLGMVSIHTTDKDYLILFIGMTIFFYYFCFGALGFSERDRIMAAVLVFGCQFIVNLLYPQMVGQHGWLMFAFIASRFAGVEHPPSEIEVPLDTKRVVLGWIALIIFVISFSPKLIEVIVVD